LSSNLHVEVKSMKWEALEGQRGAQEAGFVISSLLSIGLLSEKLFFKDDAPTSSRLFRFLSRSPLDHSTSMPRDNYCPVPRPATLMLRYLTAKDWAYAHQYPPTNALFAPSLPPINIYAQHPPTALPWSCTVATSCSTASSVAINRSVINEVI